MEFAKVDRKTGESKSMPLCVAECNLHMGVVDRADRVVTGTGIVTRKSMKWYKYFFHLLGITVLNSCILQTTVPSEKKKKRKEEAW